jgi:hypothetical protein
MVNVFSFCLYGPRNLRYYVPLLENIQIVAQYFPEWKIYIYIAPDVDPNYVKTLQSYSNVVLLSTGVTGPINMIYRFMAIDRDEVDIMMVRDADSLIHWKDRWAIIRFLEQPQYVAHTIRDNIQHVSYMMGGLWGMRKTAGLVIADEYAIYKNSPWDYGIAHDQNFLCGQIYPKVVDRLLVHYSNDRLRKGETGEEFPFAWSESLYCGRIENAQPTRDSMMFSFLATTPGR